MKERIIDFLKSENKSSAQFALEIGVQPSSISHIISGRNNPSLDFIMKMLSKYPELSADWLLFGKGNMIKKDTFGDLFDTQPGPDVTLSNKVSDDQFIEKDRVNEKAIENEPSVTGKIITEGNTGKIRKIICFYDSNTFTEYFPSGE
jgi:transcriptional regulator with XRE-family HTH domain